MSGCVSDVHFLVTTIEVKLKGILNLGNAELAPLGRGTGVGWRGKIQTENHDCCSCSLSLCSCVHTRTSCRDYLDRDIIGRAGNWVTPFLTVCTE